MQIGINATHMRLPKTATEDEVKEKEPFTK